MIVCLVTGGAGFIGSHLVEALVAKGHRVRVLDNLSSGSLGNLTQLRNCIEIVNGDVTAADVINEAMQGVDLVFHNAALPSVPRSVSDPLTTHEVCVKGTLQVLMAAHEARVQRVIYGASATAYGDGATTARQENEPLHPISPYGVATLGGEQYCASFTYLHGLETVRLRYFNVFGPRQVGGHAYAAAVPQFIEAMVAGQRPVIHGDGMQSRDFTYIDDVIQANLLAAEAPRVSGRVYNIGSGRRSTLLDLVERLNHILESEIRPIHTLPRPGDIRHSLADLARAQADLGYCPCTDVDAGLRRCIDYFAARRQGPKRISKKLVRPGKNGIVGAV